MILAWGFSGLVYDNGATVIKVDKEMSSHEVEFAKGNGKGLLKLLKYERKAVNFPLPKPAEWDTMTATNQRGWLNYCKGPLANLYTYRKINGITLEKYLKGRPNKEFLKDLLAQTMRIVKRIHQRGWSHNDIHPRNIMIEGKEAIIIDYGDVEPGANKMDLIRILLAFHPMKTFDMNNNAQFKQGHPFIKLAEKDKDWPYGCPNLKVAGAVYCALHPTGPLLSDPKDWVKKVLKLVAQLD